MITFTKHLKYSARFFCLAAAFAAFSSAWATDGKLRVRHLAREHNLITVQDARRYLLLPIQDNAPEAKLCLIGTDNLAATETVNVRLARERVDYFVPLDLSTFAGAAVTVDVQGMPADARCWKELELADTFDTTNREKFRPLYHHTPAYGWMNDPNGMFYLDGTWHLYFQHNPYGSTWGNMTWGHSTSTDLVHWQYEGTPILPDAHGTIFSGSCVIDRDNTAGFGAGAVVAFYTSAKSTPWGDSQSQSMAYSTDGGKTFTKYAGNPVLTSMKPDFRDPKVFWYAPGKHWVMILAGGQEMEIYSSTDLKQWKYESSFGLKQGAHGGVWECPDLVELPVEGRGVGVSRPRGTARGGYAREALGAHLQHQSRRSLRWQCGAILCRHVRWSEVHQRVAHADQVDGLGQGPLRHRHLQQCPGRAGRGSGLDEQLAISGRAAYAAIPRCQYHCPRPLALSGSRRTALTLCSRSRDGSSPGGNAQFPLLPCQRQL